MSTTSDALPQPDSPRLNAMLAAPIISTLIRLGWPNILMMFAQSATGIIETFFLAKLGTSVLAGVAVVVPVVMLMQNMSQGAMGGGISSAVARALGAGHREEANDLVRHAVVLNIALGAIFSVVLLSIGRVIYQTLGAQGAALNAALSYSNVICAGVILLWTMNAFSSVIRGTGNMQVPGIVITIGAALLIPISPCLIFGIGPFPALGVAGGAWALVVYYLAGTLILGWYCLSGRNAAQLSLGKISWSPIRNILTVGAVACFNAVLTNGILASAAAIVGAYAGTAALAGYATSARLEYLLMPIAFGLGAPMVAMVASNIGAGQEVRARHIALVGGAIAFLLAEVVGLIAAIFPYGWLKMFGADETMLETGAMYLRLVGPFYGFFALGFSLYFASQGARRLRWAVLGGMVRLSVCAGAGWVVLAKTHSLHAFFAVNALAMTVYGLIIFWSVWARTWFPVHKSS